MCSLSGLFPLMTRKEVEQEERTKYLSKDVKMSFKTNILVLLVLLQLQSHTVLWTAQHDYNLMTGTYVKFV